MDKEGNLDEKDVRILELEDLIARFKEYDSRRNQMYKSALQKIGMLESYIDELEQDKDLVKLREQLKCANNRCEKLRLIVAHNQYQTEATDEELKQYKLESKIITYKEMIKNLNSKMRKVNREFEELRFEYIKLKNRDIAEE